MAVGEWKDRKRPVSRRFPGPQDASAALRVAFEGGPYAEAAHIVPLGRPHDGPDTDDNILCLCPNHYVQFDKGGFTINNDLTLNELDGRLTVHRDHTVNLDHIQHHRMRFAR